MSSAIDPKSNKLSAEEHVDDATATYQAAVVSSITDLALVVDNDCSILFSSDSSTSLLGYTPDILINARLTSLVHPDFQDRLKQALTELHDGQRQEASMQLKLKTSDGQWQKYEARLRRQEGPRDELLVVFVAHNIEQRLLQEQAIQHQLFYDLQTGLLNQVALVQRFGESVASLQNDELLGLIFLDIDRLMVINKTLGHDMGNAVIDAMAERVQKLLPENSLLFRRGGDEFAILVNKCPSCDDILTLGDSLSSAFEQALSIGARDLHITLSIGAAFCPEHGNELNRLSKHASLALDHSKERSGNSFTVYSPMMDESAERKHDIEQQIHYGLKHDEFYLLYQPKIDIVNSKFIGVEALVRWNNHIFGQLSPFDFIGIAEERGLISPLGEKVLAMACKQLKQWCTEGISDLAVSVNVSSKQFYESDLFSVVRNIVQETGVDPGLLELELTETAVMLEGGSALNMMKEIRSMGIEISIDDFGTGYSSLSYLESFPADRLKIDRSFLQNVPAHQGHNKLIAAVINLGHDLGFKVIAEGIETLEQLEFVKQKNCDEIQGFLISKPVPPSVISEMWRNGVWKSVLL